MKKKKLKKDLTNVGNRQTDNPYNLFGYFGNEYVVLRNFDKDGVEKK